MTMTKNLTIAQNICDQIIASNHWCLAACGAREYVALDANAERQGGLMFRVTITARKFHKIIIELTHGDEYLVKLIKIQRPSYTVITIEEHGCLCDNLAEVVYSMCNK